MIVDVIKAILLGIVEGLTEFLPVSSTGHLIISTTILQFRLNDKPFRDAFEIFIQLGAILALIWFYRTELLGLAADLPRKPQAQRFGLALLIAFLPAAILGLVFNRFIEDNLFRSATVAATLILGGLVILAVEARQREKIAFSDISQVTVPAALAVGIAQCFSLIPGTSRSAATIVGGLLVGMDRKTATIFSFWLAIPTMIAATLYDLYKSVRSGAIHGGGDYLLLAVGSVLAFIVALWVIGAFLRFIQHNTFRGFAWYRIAVGIIVIVLLLVGILPNIP